MYQPSFPNWSVAAALIAVLPSTEAAAQASKKTEKINGYAEYRTGDTLLVEAQRVVAGPGTKVSGPKISTLASIPLGYEVKVEGHRDAGGALLATKVEARPNTQDGKEKEIIAASD